MDEILQAHESFYAALNANNHGDPVPMRAIWSRRPDVSDLGPFGGMLLGPGDVLGQFAEESSMNLGGEVVVTDVRATRAGEMGFTFCNETATGMSGTQGPVSFRATNIFRLEDGEWKMVHHHTDISPEPLAQA